MPYWQTTAKEIPQLQGKHDHIGNKAFTYSSCNRTPSSLSLNAAICASAVLSSRLSSHLDVFALMLFSVQCFALLPLLSKQIQVRSNVSFNIMLHTLVLMYYFCTSSELRRQLGMSEWRYFWLLWLCYCFCRFHLRFRGCTSQVC